MKMAVCKLLDPEVADKLDECWLLDREGNPRGSWKPIGRKSSTFPNWKMISEKLRLAHYNRSKHLVLSWRYWNISVLFTFLGTADQS
jgi:hypothetical protein